MTETIHDQKFTKRHQELGHQTIVFLAPGHSRYSALFRLAVGSLAVAIHNIDLMILIFCAFKAEADPIRRRFSAEASLADSELDGHQGRIGEIPAVLVATGIGMRRSRIAAARALDVLRPIELVVISGVAGALREDLTVGQIVLSDRFFTRPEQSFQPDQIVESSVQWRGRVAAALDHAGISYATGPVLTSRRPLMSSADKHRAHRDSGAISVDMESAVVAQEAERRGCPFVGLRAIMDIADEDVAAAELADEDGRVHAGPAARALLRDPRIILDAMHLLGNLRRATRSLAAALEVVLPQLR
jgi:adenosylhomocysteine nucleosidase